MPAPIADARWPPGTSAPVAVAPTRRGTYIILGLFLGCLGVHNFYAGYHGRGAAQLITTLLLGWVVVGFIITGIWALVEVISVTRDARGNPMA
jgi:TM2 domain-containing membrane protein YozV